MSLNTAPFQPEKLLNSPEKDHRRSCGGKYTGLAFSNVSFSTELLELTGKLVYSRYESAPALRVALS